MKAAVYLRVSTDRQDEANQEPDCVRICEQRGWEPVFFREQESGAKARPIWETLKTAVHRAEVGAVVIWALDRAGRDRVRLAHDIAELARKRMTIVSVKEAWLDQPVGPMRDLLIELMAWFAEAERARLIERTRAGQDRARREGKHIGRKWLPVEVVNRMRAEFKTGLSAFLAAKKLGIPESTVRTYYKRFRSREAFNPYPRQMGSRASAARPQDSEVSSPAAMTRDK